MVTKSKLVHVSPRTYKSPDTLNIVIRITKVWRLWFFMQLLQLFTQWVEMLCIGFSPNAFARIPSPFAISTSGERNLSSKHRCHFARRHHFLSGVVSGPLAEPSPEVARWGLLRAWLRCGTWQRRSLPAPCRTPPAQSRPLVTSCGQCWHGKKSAGNQDWHPQTQPRTLENVQCVYSHGPFRLQAQQAFSDQQKFGSEIWDALDSNHEVPDDL